ncbi:hypothetical protein TrispH2_004461 [Trichoplax sp. H2]|nr:hypothetical protein TrispH2_004461 [Trichoplax sp. H2]|eukprot:RDD43330.1 hypothetical protein TrispH2_004461 [Trichoplax sp. H2]
MVKNRASRKSGTTSPSSHMCEHKIKGKFPTNLKQHLKAYHEAEYDDVVSREGHFGSSSAPIISKRPKIKAIASKKEAQRRKSVLPCLNSVDQDAHRHHVINEKLAIFIGCSNFGTNVIGDALFRSLLQTIDKTYRIPNEIQLIEQIEQLITQMRLNIAKQMSAAKKVHFSINTRVKRGMASHYLIIIAHFFSWLDRRCHQAVLAVKSYPNSCSAASFRDVIESVFEDWGINQEKIGVLLTDSNRSISKAIGENGKNSKMREMADSAERYRGKEMDDLQLRIDTLGHDEDNRTDDLRLDLMANGHGKHLNCFADTLQLAILKFTTDQFVQQLLEQVYDLVKRVNRSSKAADQLFSPINKKLAENCPTRWISTYYLIQHLLEIKTPFNLVLENLGWNTLTPHCWKMLENIRALLQPFVQHIATLIDRKDNPTISCILPIIMELDLHLEAMKEVAEIANVSSILQLELKHKFSKWIDCNNYNYEPIFAVSTLLDPRYKFVLNPNQIQVASQQIVKYMKVKDDGSSNSDEMMATSPTDKEVADIELPSKRFHHLAKILQERLSETAKRASSAQCEVDKYTQDCHSMIAQDDPFHFWISSKYSQLSSIAVDILSIPAALANIETSFIAMVELMNETHHKEVILDQECRILLRENQQYFVH